jgi:hypothetical protein
LIAFADTDVITVKKVVKKKHQLLSKRFSLPVHRKRFFFEEKGSGQQEEFPMNKGIMPPQPQGYLKCGDHDFF